MLAFLIGIPVVPALIAFGVLASQVQVFSNLASMVLNALPNFMVTTYLFIDDMLNIIAWGKGKVRYNLCCSTKDTFWFTLFLDRGLRQTAVWMVRLPS